MGRALIETPEHEYKLLIFFKKMPTRKNKIRKLAKVLRKEYSVPFVLAYKIASAWHRDNLPLRSSLEDTKIFKEIETTLGLKYDDWEWFDKEDRLTNSLYVTNGHGYWVSICGNSVPLPKDIFDDHRYTLTDRH